MRQRCPAKTSWILALLLAVTAWAGPSSGVCAEVMQAQNSRVTMDVPAGFAKSAQFAGFQNDELQTSFVVVDMPAAAFDKLKSGLTPEGLATRGVNNAKAATLKRDGDYVYLTAEQNSAIGPIAKFLLAFKDGETTAFITGNVPKDMITKGKLKPAAIETILASATLTAKVALAKPLFTVSDLGRFKDAGTFAGTARLYTTDGITDPGTKAPGRAVFIVAPSLDLRPIPDVRAFAKAAMGQIAAATDITLTWTDDVAMGGLQGVASKATAKTTEALGFPLALYQVVLLRPEGGYFRMVGRTSEIDPAETMAEFERMARSFKPAD
jgi:hypothetical protein